MIIMFVRHADAKKDKLTKLGKLQCKLLCKSKDNIEFSKIYTSPMNRCVKTSRPIQHKLKLPTEICENLKERELLLNKEPQNEKEQEWFDNYLNPLYSSTDPEGCKEYLTRNFVEFKRIIDEHFDKNENVIIVGHSCTLYALNAYINGIKKNQEINWMKLGNCSKIYFEINNKL